MPATLKSEPAPRPYHSTLLRRMFAPVILHLAYWLGLWRLVYLVASWLRRKPLVVVFTFHRVTSNDPKTDHLVTYDRGISVQTFAMHLTEIKRRFEVLPLDQFLDVLTGKISPIRNSCILAFDDADSEFVRAAFPVLERLGCPALVFAPTDYIGTSRRFWHLRVSNAFSRARGQDWPQIQALSRIFPEGRRHWLDDIDWPERAERELACWRFNIALDSLSDQEIERVLIELESITGTDYTLGIESMNWEQLRLLEQNGIAIESHAVSHNKLARMEAAAVARELSESKVVIEQKLAKTVKAICYPAGSYNAEVAATARVAGYQVGFTTKGGILDYPKSGLDLMTLTRFDMRGNDRYEAARFLGNLPWR